EHLRVGLADFVEQRDDLLLGVRCAATDAAVVLQVLRDVELAAPSDVFLLFAHDCTDPPSFVAALVAQLAEQHAVADPAARADGAAGLPPWPATLDDAQAPPPARLRAALEFARGLLPPRGGHRLVWAMVPPHVADPVAWFGLVSALIPWTDVAPW